MRKLDLWEDLIFVMEGGTLMNIRFMIKTHFGKVLTTIIKDNEALLNQGNIGRAILIG